MCGITALSRVAERSSINDPRQFMRLAALAIESCGKDATGFAWTRSNQTSWYWKKPGPAHEVVEFAPFDDDMQVIIGHTRWATQGDVKQNENNHPVVDDGVMVVHNGVIDNDYELYDWLSRDYIPLAEVDSQVVATMLAHPDAFYAKHPTDLLGMIEGNASLAWIYDSQPGVLHLARLSGRPMTIGWTRRGDLVMSSTPTTLRRLAQLANVKIRKFRDIPEGTYLRVVEGVIVEETTFNVLKPKPKYVSYAKPQTFTTSPKGALTPIPRSHFDGGGWDDDLSGMTQDEINAFYDKQEECRRYDALNDPLTDDELRIHFGTCSLPIEQCDLCSVEYAEDLLDDETIFGGEPMIDEVDEFGLVPVGGRFAAGWKLLKGGA